MKGLLTRLILVVLAMLLLGACSAPVPAPAAVPPTKAPAAAPAPTSAPAAPTTAPAAAPTKAALTPIKLTMAQTAEELLFGFVAVARAANFYKEEGIDLEVVNTGAGAKATAAVVGGSAQLTTAGWPDGVNAAIQGQGVVALATCVNGQPYNFVMHKDVAQRLGITYQSTMADKLKALKGLKFGITSPGGGVDQLTRAMVRLAGFDPDKDVQIVAVGADGLVPALASKQLDAFTYPSPTTATSVARGDAIWLFQGPAGDLKDLPYYPTAALQTRSDLVQQNPEALRRVARATVRAAKLIKDNPTQAGALTQKLFDKVDPAVYDMSWKSFLPAYNDPALTKDDFDRTVSFLKSSGRNIPATLTFEQVYAGKFIEDAKKELGFK